MPDLRPEPVRRQGRRAAARACPNSRNIFEHAGSIWNVCSVLDLPRRRDRLPAEQRTISRHVVADPLYVEYLQKLVNVSNLASLSVPLGLQHYKLLMREAARLLRDEHSLGFKSNPVALSSMYGARVLSVWHNDTRVASLLIERRNVAQRHLCVASGFVTVVNAAQFQLDFQLARQRAVESEDFAISQPDAPSSRRRPAE